MKKIIEVSIGGINFTMEDDAYFLLKDYLKRFEETISDKEEAREVMEDVEARVAEIFRAEMKFSNQVVDKNILKIVIDHLGEIETKVKSDTSNNIDNMNNQEYTMGEKRLLRDADDKMIAGVCSGLAAYLGVDVTIVRIAFVLILFAYGTALLAYIILWMVMPKAVNVTQKLQMRGFATTAENIRRYTSQYNK